MPSPNDYQHADYLWNDDEVAGKSAVERLVYRSNCLGADGRITNTGGGNTSSKSLEIDPISGEKVDVLWVKGSGGDLRTSGVANFSSLVMDSLLSLRDVYAGKDPTGPGTPAEDEMVSYFPHCTYNLNPRATSIDTPLHGFLPARHIDHMHPNSVISVAASENSRSLTQEIFGDKIGWVPWMRPGFELGLMMQREVEKDSSLDGLVMSQHGLINWSDDDKQCYDLTLSLIEKAARFIESKDKGDQTFGGQKFQSMADQDRDALLAEILPMIRGHVTFEGKRLIGTVQTDATIQRFVNSVDAPRLAQLGTSCPDHFLRTKIKPMYVEFDPAADSIQTLQEKLIAGLERYREDYRQYYESCKHDNSPAMRNPNPSVILIPGVGMIAWGKNKSESRVTAEFYNCAVEVMRGAEAIDRYIALPQQEAFNIEYWLLEEAKLQRMPPEKALARRIVVVVGAGNGIGKQTAHRVAAEGAHVVCADLSHEAAQATADELTNQYGQGIGVAGSGLSGSGPAIGLQVDITDRDSIRRLYHDTLLAYGGVDHIVLTAGVFLPPDRDGNLSDDAWRLTFEVNVRGAYSLIDEAKPLLQRQNLPASAVLTTSVNAVVAKKGSVAYDTSKAAANHVVRELAVECAPLVRVNAIAPGPPWSRAARCSPETA